MKKLFLLMFVLSALAQGQTKEETIGSLNRTIAGLEGQIQDKNKEFYYNFFILPQRIYEETVILAERKIFVRAQKNKVAELNQQLFIAQRDSVSLVEEIKRLNTTLVSLKEQKTALIESKLLEDAASNIPDKMGPVEYRQRSRSQAFKAFEGCEPICNDKDQLLGIVINNKIFSGEVTTFTFVRTDIVEAVPPLKVSVGPKEEKEIFLNMGTYLLIVECGSFKNERVIHVDPRRTYEGMGKKKMTVHFWAVKNTSDF